MWEAVLVLAIGGLAVSRIADVVNELLSSVVPDKLGPSSLSGARVILWIVAAIFAYIAVQNVHYNPLGQVGIGNADTSKIWNILFMITATDFADAIFRRRLLRA